MSLRDTTTGGRSWSRPPFLCQIKFVAAIAAVVAFAGCATFSPLPLGNGMGAKVARLSVPASSFQVAQLAHYHFDPSNGLNVTEVAMLAVANNPELKVKRDALGIAHAQAFAAGLLPDPVIGAGMGFPTNTGEGLTRAFNFGLSEDISSILTRSTRTSAAHAQARQVNLELLWAEWQTIAKARLLFDQVHFTHLRAQDLMRQIRELAPVAHHLDKALQRGDFTYAQVASGLDATSQLHAQLATTTRKYVKAEHALRLLLGLSPQAPLRLVGPAWNVIPDALTIKHALSTLPRRRPDLLALQAGYKAQNDRLRGAILAQFPAITLGFTRQRDTSGITTNGFTIGITLPLFNRNRGNIAIARATRQRLHDAYAARLLSTRSDIDRLQQDLLSFNGEIKQQTRHTRQLDRARTRASQAWRAGDLAWPTYLAITSHALTASLQDLTLRQQRDQQAIALTTLLGMDKTASTAPLASTTPKPLP